MRAAEDAGRAGPAAGDVQRAAPDCDCCGTQSVVRIDSGRINGFGYSEGHVEMAQRQGVSVM